MKEMFLLHYNLVVFVFNTFKIIIFVNFMYYAFVIIILGIIYIYILCKSLWITIVYINAKLWRYLMFNTGASQ